MKSVAGSMCVSAVVVFVAFTAWMQIQLVTGRPLGITAWLVGVTAFAVINKIYLADSGAGISFNEDFEAFSDTKRAALYAVAIIVVVMTGIAFFLVGNTYRQTFHIPHAH